MYEDQTKAYDGPETWGQPEQAEAPTALERLGKAIEVMRDQAERLENRLAPIVGPDRPTAATGDKLVDSSTAVHTAAGKVESLAARLRYLADRIEL